MEISSRQLGSYGGRPAHSIEVTITDWGGNSSITENVTDLDGRVDPHFIFSLRELADELEEQNNLLNEQGSWRDN